MNSYLRKRYRMFMTKVFKPSNYNSVSPYFFVKGARKFIDLMKIIFDALELRTYDMPDGTIMHAEIQVDDSVIMLGESSEKFPPNVSVVHVYVQDVDRTFERAVNAGCEVVEKLSSARATRTGVQHLRTLLETCGRWARSCNVKFIRRSRLPLND